MSKGQECKICEISLEELSYGRYEWDSEKAPIYQFPVCKDCLTKIKNFVNGVKR